MEKELTELNLGGKVIPILEKDKGTSEDYAKLLNKEIIYYSDIIDKEV